MVRKRQHLTNNLIIHCKKHTGWVVGFPFARDNAQNWIFNRFNELFSFHLHFSVNLIKKKNVACQSIFQVKLFFYITFGSAKSDFCIM